MQLLRSFVSGNAAYDFFIPIFRLGFFGGGENCAVPPTGFLAESQMKKSHSPLLISRKLDTLFHRTAGSGRQNIGDCCRSVGHDSGTHNERKKDQKWTNAIIEPFQVLSHGALDFWIARWDIFLGMREWRYWIRKESDMLGTIPNQQL